LIFFSSQSFTKNLFKNIYYLTKNKELSINIITWFLLPGTVVHELSHMLMAEVLGVRTGEFSFIPEPIENNKIKAGSVKINKTDPFRYTLIGLAPFLIGLIIIFSIFKFGLENIFNNPQIFLTIDLKLKLFYILFFYLVFIISNTMFSSKKDLETALLPLITLVFIVTVLWLAKVSFSLPQKLIVFIVNILTSLNLALGLSLLINLFVLVLVKLVNFVIIKIYGRKQSY